MASSGSGGQGLLHGRRLNPLGTLVGHQASGCTQWLPGAHLAQGSLRIGHPMDIWEMPLKKLQPVPQHSGGRRASFSHGD